MRNLTATICLTLAVLLGSAGVNWGADFQKCTVITLLSPLVMQQKAQDLARECVRENYKG